jgi:DNA-binding transcriptional LysR family regulator
MPFDGRLLAGITALSAVVEAGSFVRAADALGLTQPAVSHAIARLEARVGVRLIERTTRTLRLTDEGQRFYETVTASLANIEEAVTVASGAMATVRGRLRVNVDPFFSHIRLSDKIGTFLDRYPDLELELVTRDHLGDLVADGFDLALRFGDPADPARHSRKMLDTRILTVASPAYLDTFGRPQHPAELAGGRHRVIRFRDSTTGRPFPWEFHRHDEILPVEVRGSLTVTDVEMLIGACLAGHGIAQIREMGIAELLSAGRLEDLFPAWSDERLTLRAYFPSRLSPPAKVRAFLDFVLAET